MITIDVWSSISDSEYYDILVFLALFNIDLLKIYIKFKIKHIRETYIPLLTNNFPKSQNQGSIFWLLCNFTKMTITVVNITPLLIKQNIPIYPIFDHYEKIII